MKTILTLATLVTLTLSLENAAQAISPELTKMWAQLEQNQLFEVLPIQFMNIKDDPNIIAKQIQYDGNGAPIGSAYTPLPVGPFDWIPTGGGHVEPNECRSLGLHEQLIKSTSLQAQSILQKFHEQCDLLLASQTQNWLVHLVSMQKIYYDLGAHPSIKLIRMKLSDGTLIRGILALKDLNIKRPLVVIKCGLACDAGNYPFAKIIMMHMFDESPFHVLLLSNSTGSLFSAENDRISMGGVADGLHSIRVAEIIKKSALSTHISSYHNLGFSLGGHAALYASVYDSYQSSPTFRSTIALCPVVDLETTVMRNYYGKGLLNSQFRSMARDQLLAVLPLMPIVQEIFSTEKQRDKSKVPQVVLEGTLKYYARASAQKNWALPPFVGTKMDTLDAVWSANNFLNFFPRIKNDTLIWASEDDGIVQASANSQPLQQRLTEKPNPFINILISKYGSHCGLGLSQGWDTFGQILRAHILRNSPEMLKMRRVELISLEKVQFSDGLLQHAKLDEKVEKIISTDWEVKPNQNAFRVEIKTWSTAKSDRHCPNYDNRLTQYTSNCVNTYSIRVPIEILKLQVPDTTNSAHALSRWANANLQLLNAKGQSILDTGDVPTKIRKIEYR